MSMLKKILVLLITPLIAILLVVLKIKPVEDYLKQINEKAPLYLSILIVGLTLLSQYLTVISPFKKYEKWAKNKWYILNAEGKKLIQKYEQQGISLNFNIMVPRLRFFYSINPKRGNLNKTNFTFVGKVFKDIWNLGTPVNKLLNFTTKQGVCGQAFRTGNICGAEFVTDPATNFNFTVKQQGLTNHLKIVISCPIIIINEGPDQQSGKTIAVLNVESESDGSEALMTVAGARKTFFNELIVFANLCSKLM